MSVTFPSKPVVAIDVPEVRDFRAEFKYNFFTPDERTNEEGTVPGYILRKKTESFDSDVIDKIQNIVPRFVRFDFRPIVLDQFSFRTPKVLDFTRKSNLSINKFFDRIYTEDRFANSAFTGLQFQDTGIDGKFYMLMSGTLAKRMNAKNLEIARAINDEIQTIGTAIDSNQVSLLDVSKFLNGETGVDISDKFIIKSLNKLQSLGAIFLDKNQMKEQIEESFENIKEVKTKIKINNKVLNAALQTSVNDPVGIFSDEIGPMLEVARAIEKQEISYSTNNIDAIEYDIVVDAILQKVIPPDTVFIPEKRLIGYIIEKFELLDNGLLEPQTPIVLEQQNISTAVDFKVAYGTTYVYQIRSVAQMTFQTTDPDTDELLASTILISSSPSKRIVLECVENVPPPPPVDFDIQWDSREKAARLMWAFPTNPQRDIKRFQIFRRKTIFEPFELIREYDFDDSDIKTRGYERPNLSLIERLENPKTFWLDKEFNKNSKYIYAICSIDAHGLTSNYSMQFEVFFDRFKNKIEKKMISGSGAPKPYPNMYLQEEVFVDTIKDSGHTRLKIYFDPEYLSVFYGRKSNTDLGLLATNRTGGSYKMQFINVDLQKSQTIDIILDDKRKSRTKYKSPNSTIFIKKNK